MDLPKKTNGTLVDRMAAYVQDSPQSWDRYLASAVFSLVSSKHGSTSFSPFQIMFGVLPVLPIETRFPRPPPAVEQPAVRDRVRTEVRQITSRRIRAAQQKQKEYYDSRRSMAQEFLPGELVVVRRHATKKGIPKKLQPRYIGPFEILQKLSATTYQVGDLECNRTSGRWWVFSAHTSQLKRWRLPPSSGDDEIASESDWQDVLTPDIPVPEADPVTVPLLPEEMLLGEIVASPVATHVPEKKRYHQSSYHHSS